MADDTEADTARWNDQVLEGACAVVSQGSIIEEIIGVPFDQGATTKWLAEQLGFRSWRDRLVRGLVG